SRPDRSVSSRSPTGRSHLSTGSGAIRQEPYGATGPVAAPDRAFGRLLLVGQAFQVGDDPLHLDSGRLDPGPAEAHQLRGAGDAGGQHVAVALLRLELGEDRVELRYGLGVADAVAAPSAVTHAPGLGHPAPSAVPSPPSPAAPAGSPPSTASIRLAIVPSATRVRSIAPGARPLTDLTTRPCWSVVIDQPRARFRA